MAGSSAALLREVRRLIKQPGHGSSDRELLQRFCQDRDEAAFAELVRRHGTLVLGVCRRVLQQSQDAEDAFQATFLLLAQKAASVRKQESLASWLYGVAQRVAGNAQIAAQRRRRRERAAAIFDRHDAQDDVRWQEVRSVLHEELGRLPERYRAPLLLCYLEGLTQEDAARQLGWTPHMVHGRLYRGRDLLRRRLTGRGLSLGAGILATVLCQPTTSAAMALLRKATVKAVLPYAAGRAVGTLSADVVALAQQSVPMITTFKGRLSIVVFLALTMIAAGAGVLAHQPASTRDDEKKPTAQSTDPSKPVAEEKQTARLDRFGDPLPEDAVARLGTVRFRHGGKVLNIAYSPDGQVVASSGRDNMIRIWDAATGKELHCCVGHTDQLIGLTYAPDGKTLVSAGLDHTIRIWDPNSGKEIQQWNCNTSVRSIAFSPDGKTLATSDLKIVRLWDLSTGAERGTITGHNGRISCLAFSPDHKHLASASAEDETVRIWELATATELSRMASEKDNVYRLLFSPDGKGLLTGGSDGVLHWWETTTGKEVKQFVGPKQNGPVPSIAIADDGKTLFSGDTSIRAWDVATAKELRVLGKHGDCVGAMALSPNGKVLATAGDNAVRLWDTETAKEIRFADGHETSIGCSGFTPDGRTAVSTGLDGIIRKWDANTGKELGKIDAGCQGISALSNHAKRVSVTTLKYADNIRVWDVGEGEELPSPKLDKIPFQFQGASGRPLFSPDSQILAVPVPGGICLSEVGTGRELRILDGLSKTAGGQGFYVHAFSADGTILAATDGIADGTESNKLIHLFDVASGNEIKKIWSARGSTCALTFSPDGRRLAAWHNDSRRDKWVLALWEIATGQECALIAEEPVRPISRDTLAFSPDGRLLATTGLDNTVQLWDVATGRPLHTFQGHRGRVYSLSFSADGKRLMSGSVDTSILIWDVARVLKESPTRSAALSPKELEDLWKVLRGGNATQAYQAMAKFSAAPKETYAFFKDNLRPQEAPDLKVVPRLLADLDADDFAIRKKAVEELERLGGAAEPALRKALEDGQASLERRQQLERLLEKLAELSPEHLQVLRALEVVERLDTAESRQLLEKLAAGPANDFLTKEAKAITKRLATKEKK